MSFHAPHSARPVCSAIVEPVTPFHLSAEQIRSFDDNGYLVLKRRITGPLLARVQAAGHRWIEQARAVEMRRDSGRAGRADTDYVFAKRPGGKTVPFRVNYLHSKGEPA